MTFSTAIRTCLHKYATFRGRASRSEYWWFVLFLILGTVAAGTLDGLLFGYTTVQTAPGQFTYEADGPIAAVFSLATLLPLLAAGWRRMHDSGRSGLNLLYPIIAAIGTATALGFFGGIGALDDGQFGTFALIVLVPAAIIVAVSPLIVIWWLTRPSQPGPNSFGPNPHEVTQ